MYLRPKKLFIFKKEILNLVGCKVDGRVVEIEGKILKTSDIEPSFTTEYHKQI